MADNVEVKLEQLTDAIRSLYSRPSLTQSEINNLMTSLAQKFENSTEISTQKYIGVIINETKKVLEELFNEVKMPSKIIEEKGWVQISDENAIKEVVEKVLSANPQSISDYKAGKDKALGFLVGQAMKETKGKANPQLLNKLFLEELKK